MAAYERFAINQPPFLPEPAFCQSIRPKPEERMLTQPAPPASKPVREPSVDHPSNLTGLASRDSLKLLQEQQTAIEQLTKICENLMQERNTLRQLMEGLPSSERPQNEAVQEDKRFEALRRLLAKELHPDKAKRSSEEAALRNDLFQRLWPQIDRVAKGQSIK